MIKDQFIKNKTILNMYASNSSTSKYIKKTPEIWKKKYKIQSSN